MRKFTAVLVTALVAMLVFTALVPAANAASPSSAELLKKLKNGGNLSSENINQLMNKWWYLTQQEQKLLRNAAINKGIDRHTGLNNSSSDNKNDDEDNNNNNNNNNPAPYTFGFAYVPNYYNYALIPPAGANLNAFWFIAPTNPAYVYNGATMSIATLNGTEIIPAPPYDHNMPWGSFGTYQNWANAFFAGHGRPPLQQDEVDFWASQAFAARTGFSPFGF